ncbi:MAG: 50S ribosomal protein L24 [Phycisphaerae bacterium]|jgi:large subunit ribosomal protein L24|nr:50S ribosomal protein L24 [Phycisphaerae bacterium]
MACHIRKDDQVEVIAGDHVGERGKVLKVFPKKGLVLVQGVNTVFRHVRPSRRNPQGGRLQKEAPIHISNVAPYDEKAGCGARVRFEVERNTEGKVKAKYRVSVRGSRLSELTRDKADE